MPTGAGSGRAVLTISAAVGVIGFVFGVGAVAAGASVAQTVVMSLLVFTGASQFSAVSVVASGGSTGAALGGAMILAARNTVYGLADVAVHRRVAAEASRRGADHDRRDDGHGARRRSGRRTSATRSGRPGSCCTWCWNTGGLIGALVGGSMNPETFGLDVAFPAAFVAMVLPHLRHRRGLIAGMLGAAICLVLIPFTPVGVPILCASAAILVGLPRRPWPARCRPRRCPRSR